MLCWHGLEKTVIDHIQEMSQQLTPQGETITGNLEDEGTGVIRDWINCLDILIIKKKNVHAVKLQRVRF